MEYKLDKIEHIENDIDKIRIKPGMYMSYVGSKGTLHLSKEIINNCIDECENKDSPGDTIEISYDIATGVFTATDNGRGIDPDGMLNACTKINAGSKFTRATGGNTAGENGCGLTCVNAMSEKFEMIVNIANTRKTYSLTFNEGVLVEQKEKSNTSGKHGTTIRFSPSRIALGKKSDLPWEEMVKWVKSIMYLLKEKIRVNITIWKGQKLVDEYKLKSKPFTELLKDNVAKDKRLSDVITINNSMKTDEVLMGKKYKRTISLTCAFCYATSEPYIDTYCNFVNTIDNGSHFDAVKESLCRYFVKATKDSMSERDKLKMDIVWADVMDSLSIVINLGSDYSVGFTGQTKQKIDKEEIFDFCKLLCSEGIDKYFSEHKEQLTQMIKNVRLNAKARTEANKAKQSVIKETTNIWKEHAMPMFVPANNRGKQYKELFIIEGESAKGSAELGRDPDTQALFAMRGVSANAFKRDEAGILKNEVFKNLITIMKCNIGAKFKLEDLAYDKIIIMTDADIDGFGIRSLVAAFFIRFFPEIVKAGKLYVVVPPLYEINDKKNPFVIDKKDYVNRFIKSISKLYSVTLAGHEKKLDKDEMYDFIYSTKDTLQDIDDLSRHFRINPQLIECVIAFIAAKVRGEWKYSDMPSIVEKYQRELMIGVQKLYPEVSYNNGFLRGIIDGRLKSLELNERFFRRAYRLYDIYRKYGYMITVEDSEKNSRIMSIYDFLNLTKQYRPNIITRYKGLGENDADDLWTTTLNPDNRTLIQLTIDDYDKDMDMFHIMHSQAPKYAKARKDMMSAYHIDRDDLDN